MGKTVIDKIVSVSPNECHVNLRNMRADLSQNIIIKIDEIQKWFSIDADGYSVKHELKEGKTIYFDSIFAATRRMCNPRFEE